MATITTATGSVSAGAKEIIVTAATGVAVVVLLYWLAKREIGNAAGAVADAAGAVGSAINKNLNPTKDTNIAYRAAGGITTLLGGDPANSLGTQIYEDVQTVKTLLNPASSDNIVQQAGNAIVRGVTGSQTETLSMKIGDGIDWLKRVF